MMINDDDRELCYKLHQQYVIIYKIFEVEHVPQTDMSTNRRI